MSRSSIGSVPAVPSVTNQLPTRHSGHAGARDSTKATPGETIQGRDMGEDAGNLPCCKRSNETTGTATKVLPTHRGAVAIAAIEVCERLLRSRNRVTIRWVIDGNEIADEWAKMAAESALNVDGAETREYAYITRAATEARTVGISGLATRLSTQDGATSPRRRRGSSAGSSAAHVSGATCATRQRTSRRASAGGVGDERQSRYSTTYSPSARHGNLLKDRRFGTGFACRNTPERPLSERSLMRAVLTFLRETRVGIL